MSITWVGASGTEYEYTVHPLGTQFPDAPGNYMFLKETEPTHFISLYVGETGSLADRLNAPRYHHQFDCVEKRGCEHICVHGSSEDEEVRRAEEMDLIDKLDPPCQGKST